MSQLYGFQAGQQIADQDKQRADLANMSMQEHQVALDSARSTLAQQDQMIKMMQGMNGAPGAGGQVAGPNADVLASQMDQLAQIAIKTGNPEKAKAFAATGSTIRKNSQDISSKQTTQAVKMAGITSNLMEGVKDQDSWQKANAAFEVMTGHPSRFANQPYSPGLVDQIKQATQTVKERAQITADLARAASSKASAAESTTRQDLIKAQTSLAQAREDAIRKTGVKNPGPKAASVKAIQDLATTEYSAGPEELRVLSRPVAERMEQLMLENNLSQSEAANQAYQEAKGEAAFGGLRQRSPHAGTVEKPMDMPSFTDAKDAATKMTKNKYYTGKPGTKYEGKTLLWTGTGFKLKE